MLKIREQQLVELRRLQIGDALLDSMLTSRVNATRDAATGDILVADANANTTRIGFDKQGFIGSVTSPLGRKWSLDNDRDGKMLALSGPAGNRITFEYDLQSNVSEISVERRKLLEIKYGPANLPAQIAFPDGTTRRLEYDDAGRVAGAIDRVGGKAAYEYDPAGNPITIIDGNGNRTRFSYSGKPRPDAAHFPDGSSETYRYNANGTLRAIAIGTQNLAELVHDGDGRVVKVSHSDGEIVTYNYNDDGLLVEASNSQATISCLYDDDGRITEESDGEHGIQYDYDASGSLIGITYPSGERVAFEYDPDLRLQTVRDWHGGEHRFRYAPDERTIDAQSPNGLTTKSVHTLTGLPIAVTVLRDIEEVKRELFSLKFTYDSEDRLLTFADSEFGLRHYGYDAEGQLLSVDADDIERRESFAYDKGGNRIRCNAEFASINAVNQMTSQGAMQCSYDARGNVVAITSPDGAWRFTYNSRNLMIRAEDQIGRVSKFSYDAFGRRISKQSGTTHTRYVWAGENMVREITTDGNATRIQDYLYYPGTHTPLATRIDRRIYTYHCDHLGTPRRLTDEDGTVVWSAEYAGFGEATVKIDNVWNPLRLPGQYFDHEIGLHYNRFRYYAPKFGRYLARDPVTFVGGLNFYMYSDNNPINGADPLGLWSWKTVVAVGAAVAVGVAVVALAPIALPLAIVAAGAAAGAVGAGLNEALNQEKFNLKCILQAALKGAIVGTIAALPFAFLPAAAGVVAYTATGAASGGLGYTADHLLTPGSKWDWVDFAKAVGIGAATAGVGRYLGGKYSQWRQSRAATAEARNAVPKPLCTTTGHPVDVATGKVFTTATDFELPSVISIRLERTWYSTSTYRGPLGHGWHHSYDLELTESPLGVSIRLGDGRRVSFPMPRQGGTQFDPRECLKLTRLSDSYALQDASGLTFRFSKIPSRRSRLAPSRIEDRNENHLALTYNDAGHLAAITDNFNRTLEFKFDSFGRVTSLSAPHPNDTTRRTIVASYAYDNDGNLISVADALGSPFQYSYRRHLLTQETNRNGFNFYFEYDGSDEDAWCTRTWGDGRIIDHRLEYDLGRQITVVTDSLGNSTKHRWTNIGVVIETEGPTGGIERTTYDNNLRVVSRTDTLNHSSLFHYDHQGNRIEIVDPCGATTKLEYNAQGLPKHLVDVRGQDWRREYDERGNLTSTVDPLGNRWVYEYDQSGLLKTATNPKGAKLSIEYDSFGYVSRMVDYGDGAHALKHDRWGRLVERTDPNGNSNTYQYDLLNRRIGLSLSEGLSYSYEFDNEGNPIRFSGPEGTFAYRYWGYNLLSSVEGPSGDQTRYRYDTECRCVEIVNPDGATHEIAYDAAGRAILEKRFDGLITRYEYDQAGRLIRYSDAGTRDIRLTRDPLGRLLAKESANGTKCTFQYDPAGNLLQAINDKSKVQFEYDATSRVIVERVNGFDVQSQYDEVGNRIVREFPTLQVSYGYDPNSALAEMKLGSGKGIYWQRDGLGDACEISWPNSLSVKRYIDPAGRLADQRVLAAGGDVKFAQRFHYVGQNSPSKIEDSQFGVLTLDYDERGLLSRAWHDDGENESFQYDRSGNLLSIARTSSAGAITSAPASPSRSAEFEFDKLGRAVGRTDGRLTTQLHYDDFDRLTEAKVASGETYHYDYDALGRRIRKRFANGTISAEFVWDGALLAEEHLVEGTTAFIHDDEDAPVAMLRGEQTFYYENDHLSRPRRMFDEGGACVWAADYHAYGDVRREQATTITNPLRFPGQYQDAETGLHYNFQRYYDPVEGRYVTPDPLGLRSGGQLYQYTPNPLAWIDPFGLITVFRNLRPDEDPSAGLTAKNPGRGMKPSGHVMNGSKPSFKGSQYISTTTDPEVSAKWRQEGQRTVAIDTDLIEADAAGNKSVVDLSTAEKAEAAGLKGRPKGYAVSSKEVLVEGRIPPKAITPVC